jgi:FAD/FMN-containing dehydrogenase
VPELDLERAVYEVVALRRGSVSAEHGVGSLRARVPALTRAARLELALMRAIKQAIDPRRGVMNPGKVI